MGYDAPAYLISAAAQRAGMHAQTLRTYARLGLVVPRRAAGRGRRYSLRGIDKLKAIERLSNEEWINLAGIARIFARVAEHEQLGARVEDLLGSSHQARVRTAAAAGDIAAAAPGERPRVSGDSRGVVVWERRHIELRRG